MKKNLLSIILTGFIASGVCVTKADAEVLVYQGQTGPGVGKHIVFIASDHEYHSAETCPALARILAKRFGFTCTVLFGQRPDGQIQPGNSHVPGMENLQTADLLVLFVRFQAWNDEQMKHFLAYLDRAGPIVGLRTSTHAFNFPKDSPYSKYNDSYTGDDYAYGFGKQVLGLSWRKYGGHYGANHHQSTRHDNVDAKQSHPILRGVSDSWAYCGGYAANLDDSCEVLTKAQPLQGIHQGAAALPNRPPVPAAWTRTYASKEGQTRGRVFTSIYGSSPDLVNRGYRRTLVNACIWAVGLEDAIDPAANVDFVAPYVPTFGPFTPPRQGAKPSDYAGWQAPIAPAFPAHACQACGLARKAKPHPVFVSTEPALRCDQDFTVAVTFQTTGNGTLFAKCAAQGKWEPKAKALFIRQGQLVYDIGWVGHLTDGPKVNDGKPHQVVLRSLGGRAEIFLDGTRIAQRNQFTAPDIKGHVFKVGAAANDFGKDFSGGTIGRVQYWPSAIDGQALTSLLAGKAEPAGTPALDWSPSEQDSPSAPQPDPNAKNPCGSCGQETLFTKEQLASQVSP